jgi:hypothetical protein
MVRGSDLVSGGEGEKQLFVVGDVIQNAREEKRLARRGADVAWSHSGCGKERTQPVRIRRNEAKRLYCQGFRGFAGGSY